MKGFTLVEVVIVLGIFGLILAIGLPVGIDAYRNYLLTSENRNLMSVLRRAEEFAFSNKNESDYGVYLEGNNFVLFKGSSFAGRDENYDEEYPREPSVLIGGFTEIVFSRNSGNPNATATIVLSNNLASQSIDINEEGAIFW